MAQFKFQNVRPCCGMLWASWKIYEVGSIIHFHPSATADNVRLVQSLKKTTIFCQLCGSLHGLQFLKCHPTEWSFSAGHISRHQQPIRLEEKIATASGLGQSRLLWHSRLLNVWTGTEYWVVQQQRQRKATRCLPFPGIGKKNCSKPCVPFSLGTAPGYTAAAAVVKTAKYSSFRWHKLSNENNVCRHMT